MNKIYEKYHSNRELQKSIIKSNDFTYQVLLRVLRKHIKKSDKVLDVGCGVGTIDFYLSKRGAKVTGIDISENGIKIAKQNNKNLKHKVTFKVADITKDKITEKYDVIVCSEVLEHLKDDKKAVKKLYGLLNKNGILIASSPSKNSFLYKMGFLKIFDKEVGHLRRYSENSFRKLFADFEIIKLNKNQGIIRDLLFTNNIGGFLLKFIKREPFSTFVTVFDNLCVKVLGESDYLIVAKKK